MIKSLLYLEAVCFLWFTIFICLWIPPTICFSAPCSVLPIDQFAYLLTLPCSTDTHHPVTCLQLSQQDLIMNFHGIERTQGSGYHKWLDSGAKLLVKLWLCSSSVVPNPDWSESLMWKMASSLNLQRSCLRKTIYLCFKSLFRWLWCWSMLGNPESAPIWLPL